MANRFPLIVNESSRKIEEMISGDNLDLTGNGIAISGNTGTTGQYLKSDGGVVSWDNPGDVYLTLTQTLTNKTLETCIINAAVNTVTNIPNSGLANSSITVNGTPINLGGSVTTPDTNTTYSTSMVDGATATQKILRLTGSDTSTDDVIFAVGTPASVPSGSNALVLEVTRVDDTITFAGSVPDNNTVTTLQSFTGGTAQTGAMVIKGAGGATVTQDAATRTITIDSANDDTITRLRGGSGQTFADGDFTILAGSQVTVTQAPNGTTGLPEITIGSFDTITRLKGGGSGTLTSGDITISGGSGGNVTVSQSGSTIEIDSQNDDTITKIASGSQTLASGNFIFKQAGATTITQTTLGNGDIEIEIDSANDDTGASLGAGTGLTLSNGDFSLKGSANLIDNRIPIWDDANGQFVNGSITDDGSQVTIDGDLVVLGTNTILETSTLQVEDNLIELRKGNSLTGTDSGIQINRTTTATGQIQTFIRMEWYESGQYWRSYDGSVANRLVTENETQTLTQKILDTPTLIAPTLGDATATTLNGMTITSTSGSTYTLGNLKTFSVNNSLTLNANDTNGAVIVNFDTGGGTGAKVAYNTYNLGEFAVTSSAQLASKIQDKSGSGKLLFDTNPVIVDSIITQSNSFDLLNTAAAGINFGGGATQIEIGSTSGTTSINHSLEIDGNTTIGTADGGDSVLINANPNFENHDITIRGTDATPMYIGRGGGAVNSNTRVGYAALGANQSGSQNTAMGWSVLINNVAGAANTGIGHAVLRDNDGGSNNVGVGKGAAILNESGDNNVAVGVSSLANNVGSDNNVCIGHYAGHAVTGAGNVLIGPASTEDSLSATYAPPSAGGDNQLVIGSGTSAWVRGDAQFNVTLPQDLRVNGDTVIDGDLTVTGTRIELETSVLTVDDKNIELASVSNLTVTADVQNGQVQITNISPTVGIIEGMGVTSPGGAVPAGTIISTFDANTATATLSNAVSSSVGSEQFIISGPIDTAADGGGLIIKGTPVLQGGTGDKTFLYDHSRVKKYFVSSENIELANGKELAIGNQLALSSTTLGNTVVNSSLTSVGVLVGPTGQPALETDGAVVFGGRVLENAFSSMATEFTNTSNTVSITAAAANTICGKTNATNSPINTWAISTADPDGNTIQNGQSLTVTLIIDGSTASTYGDGCTVDGVSISTGVRWSGGSPPIATNNTDILTFLVVKDSAGVIRVYGQGNTDFS